VTAAPSAAEAGGELRLDLAGIELLAARVADLIAQRLAPQSPASTGPDRLLSATEVSKWWGVSRGWVYRHAVELGAVRIGDGERPRLRFHPDQVSRRLARPPSTPPAEAVEPPRYARRSPRIRRDSPPLAFHADPELSSLNRDKEMAGRRGNAPGRGAEDMAFGTTTSLPPPRSGAGGSHQRPSPALRRRHRR
jgi:hypothetical protein